MHQLGNVASLNYFGAEIILAAAIVMAFILDLMTAARNRVRIFSIFTLVALLAAGISVYSDFLSTNFSLFGGMLVNDPLANFFKMLILISTALVTLIAARDSETNQANQGEFFTLMLTMAFAAILLSSATNLLMTYIGLEFLSLVSYVLAGFLKSSRRSSEASMKYVIYGGVASGAMIYGMSFLYGLTGSLDFATITATIQAMDQAPASSLALFMSALLILAGFGYKIAAVPFHMWCPDVYEGAPTPVTAYFSVVPKVAGFAAMIRFFYLTLSTPSLGLTFAPLLSSEWPFLLAVISMATMTLGNLVAIHQTSMKRLLAFSSIAHAGYILMAFVVLTRGALSAILFYLAVYAIMNLGAFFFVILVREACGSDHIDKIRGLAWRGGHATFAAVCMAVFLFSLTGLPPTAGFIGKVYLFSAVIKEQWYWLAVVGVLNSVVSLYYYARFIKAMFLTREFGVADSGSSWMTGAHLSKFNLGVLALLAVLTLYLGLFWTPLIQASSYSVTLLGGK